MMKIVLAFIAYIYFSTEWLNVKLKFVFMKNTHLFWMVTSKYKKYGSVPDLLMLERVGV